MTNINEKITAFAGGMLEESYEAIRNKIWDKLPDERKEKITAEYSPEAMADINTYLAMIDQNELKSIIQEVIKELVRVKISKNARNMVNNVERTNKGFA